MGFFNTVSEVFKDSASLKLNWKQNANNVKNLFTNSRKQAVVAISVDDVEFMTRYKNVRFSAFSSMFFLTISFLIIPFVSNWMGFITAILSVTLFFLFYFRYAFILWVCRKSWAMSVDLESPVQYTAGGFLKAITDDAAEFLPLKLPKKGVKK